MLPIALSLAVLAALLLCAGAVMQARRGERGKAALMVLLAAVLAVNVGIWTLPDADGRAPVDRAGQGPR